MDYRDVCGAIVSGKISMKYFDAIRQAMQHAKEISTNGIKIGDTIKFNLNAKPRYMFGLKAKVTKVNKKTFQVKMIDGAGRFTKGLSVKAPKTIVDKA